MADSNASKPRSGWFQWALRRLWRLGRPGRLTEATENEEKFKGSNLPTIGAPVALVHERKEDKNRVKTAPTRTNESIIVQKTQEKEPVVLERSKKEKEQERNNDLQPPASRKTLVRQSADQTAPGKIPDPASKQVSDQAVSGTASRVPVQKPRPNVFTNTLNKRAQELLLRDLQNASASAIAKQRGSTQKKSKIPNPGLPTSSIPRPTVPTMGRGPKVHKDIISSTSPRPQSSAESSAQRTGAVSSASPSAASGYQNSLTSSSVPKHHASPRPRIMLTGFDKLVNKEEKEIAERMRMSRPTISIQSIVRTNNTHNQKEEANTSLGEEIYQSWINATPREKTKKVKAIRINPSSSESSRSPSPTGTKPSKGRKKGKRLFVYSDSEDEVVEESTSANAPVAKRQKPSSSPQVVNTPNKMLTLPPIAHLQLSTPNQVVLPPIRNLNTKFQLSPQPQPPTPKHIETRLQSSLAGAGPRLSPIAARYSQSPSLPNSYASSKSAQTTPVQFERPRVPPIKLNTRRVTDMARDRQTGNTTINGQPS